MFQQLKARTEEFIKNALVDCDTRIQEYTDQIKEHEMVIEKGDLECVAYDADLLLQYQAFKKESEADTVIMKVLRKAIQIEKQIYISRNNKTKQTMLPLFLSKFDECLAESYALMEEQVKIGNTEENEYLFLCQKSGEHRNSIKNVCDFYVRDF